MALDVSSIMVVGLLISLLTVVLFMHVSRGFPTEHRRHVQRWTVALAMQPMAWLALSLRGQVNDLVSIGMGTFLLLASHAEMVRALRGFQGLPDRRWLLWGVVVVAMAVSLFFSGSWPHSSTRVITNSLGGIALLLAMAWSLRAGFRAEHGHAARAMALFALFGAGALLWRTVDHALYPRVQGELLPPEASDLAVFLYANTSMIFLSLCFVLMHAERAYAALHRVASVDALTGVLARSGLEEQGQRMVAEARRLGRPMSALLLDLDHFKPVNDRLGHEAGDQMLRHLAGRAHRVLRGQDLLFRLGGDEFVALLPNTDGAQARIVADRLRDALAETVLVFRGQELPIPLSIGIADTRGDFADLDTLVKRADEAMYMAKRAGGDRVQVV